MATATVNPQAANAAANTETAQAETPLFTQSYSFKIPKNADGVKEIFAGADGEINEKALVYALRAGIKQIVNNRVRQQLTAKDEAANPTFTPQAEIVDFTKLLLDEPQRQVLSQRDKLKKNLEAASLPAAVIDTMLATYDLNVGAADTGGNTSTTVSEARVYPSKDGKSLVMKLRAASDDEDEE